jgi:hypothetical protein
MIEFFENVRQIDRVNIGKGLFEDLKLDIAFETADLRREGLYIHDIEPLSLGSSWGARMPERNPNPSRRRRVALLVSTSVT